MSNSLLEALIHANIFILTGLFKRPECLINRFCLYHGTGLGGMDHFNKPDSALRPQQNHF